MYVRIRKHTMPPDKWSFETCEKVRKKIVVSLNVTLSVTKVWQNTVVKAITAPENRGKGKAVIQPLITADQPKERIQKTV